jgi:hypothetical protein
MLSNLIEIGKNCWVIEASKKSPLGRRMTIIKCQNDDLFIHSCIKLESEQLNSLKDLGRVKWILVPNNYHTKDIAWFSRQFPEAEVLCTSPITKKLHRLGLSGLTLLPHCFPDELLEVLSFKIMESVKNTEIECFHAESKSLIVTDLVFNLNVKHMSFVSKFFHKLNQSDRFGPTKLFKKLFLLNKTIFLEEIDELLSLDFDKIILSHGDIINDHAKEKLESIKEML